MMAKVDSLKDEMDEALNKVEICKVDVALMLLLPDGASFTILGSHLMTRANKGRIIRTV